jgi:anti-sigma B factor antagonist
MEFYFHEVDRDVLILSADGGLNAQTASQFVGELERLIEQGTRKIIVDCTHLDYISSYGIGVLIRLHKHLAKYGGDVKLAGIQSLVISVLRTVRMDKLFEIYPDIDQARLAFRPEGA